MAFTVTKEYEKVFQGIGARIVCGKYVNDDSSTGGDIDTTLGMVYAVILQAKGTAVTSEHPVVNETLPTSSKITIVTSADETGYWIAIGS